MRTDLSSTGYQKVMRYTMPWGAIVSHTNFHINIADTDIVHIDAIHLDSNLMLRLTGKKPASKTPMKNLNTTTVA